MTETKTENKKNRYFMMSSLSPHNLLSSPPAAIFFAAPNLAPAVSSACISASIAKMSSEKDSYKGFFRLQAAILQYTSAFCIATPS